MFVQTSRHEGFCLPVLEAMAAGAPVVCTDADGNRDFCRDGENCLMPAAEPARGARRARARARRPGAARAAVAAGLRDGGGATTGPGGSDELERFFERVAGSRAAVAG